MRRIRARLVACAVVLAAAGGAYAAIGLVATNNPAASNPYIPDGSGGNIVFSLRNPIGGSMLQITGFTAEMAPPFLPAGCSGVSIQPLTGSFPVTIAAGQQAQFVATASGFGTKGIDSTFTCTWDIATNPISTPPADTVTTQFNTTISPITPLDVQPQRMDFQVNGTSEQQEMLIADYSSAMNVNLVITGDDTTNYFSFTNGACSGHTCNMQSLAGGGVPASFWIQCTPMTSSPVSAVLDVQDGGGSSLGSAQLDCSVGSGGSGTSADINIVETTIPIMGQQGNTAFSFGTITTSNTGQLGSATIASPDTTMKLSFCGLTTCTWSPAQGLMPSYPLQVECVPGSTQTTGTLTVFEAGGSATDSATVTCTGSGGSPMLSVTPGSLAFSTQQANTTSAPQQIHISNTGGSQLDSVLIDFGVSVNASQWHASACTAQTGACSFGPGSGSDVDITFGPTSIGPKDVTLNVSSNGGSDTVSLTGTGTGGIMSVTTPSGPNYLLDIGTIPRGQPFSRDIVLANTGNALYTATTSTPGAPYTIQSGPFSVIGGSSTSITVTCQSATATTTDNPQTITITSADAYSGSPQSVDVRCKIADTLVQISPMSFDYGEVRLNTLPEPVTPITITNPSSSAADAQVTGFTLRNSSPGLRLVTPALPFSIAPGSTQNASLQLLTGSDTDVSGEYLDITVDGAMLSLPVTGKVVTPHSRIVPPDKLDLGTACAGTQVSGNVMLINDGTATLMVDPPTMDQSFIAAAPGTPGTLAANTSITAMITPAVSASGNVAGTLTWKDDVPSEHMLDVTLDYVTSGTALSPRGLDFGSTAACDPSDPKLPCMAGPQHIKLQNCDLAPASIKVESLKTKAGTLGAWIVEPRVGFTKQLAAKEEQAITVSFEPPARGRYEAELTVSTQAGKQIIHLVGDATGRDWQDTSFYACACNGPGAPQRGWPVLLAVVLVTFRRRRGSSSPR